MYVHNRAKITTPDRTAELNTEREPTLPCVLDNHDLTALIPGVRAKGTTGSRKDRKKKVRNRNNKENVRTIIREAIPQHTNDMRQYIILDPKRK